MPYLTADTLDAIVVDFTSHCNSMCGNCSRNLGGVKVNPSMPLSHMTMETWKNIIDNSTTNEIIFNGNYGDALMNPILVEALEYAASEDIQIMIHTNGGVGMPEQYVALANVLKKFKQPSGVTWSIDGLEDTNHLYRRGVIWERIMNNAKAFIQAGGKARWRMLVFEHNAHQLEEVEQLSKDMGFLKFDINGGYTFTALNSIVDGAIEKFKANKKDEARVVKYDSKHLDQVERLEKIKDFSETTIKCKWQNKRKIQINHIGEVLPCCYLLSDRWPKDINSPYAKQQNDIVWPNVNDRSLTDIIEGEELLMPSKNRFKICEVTCGEM